MALMLVVGLFSLSIAAACGALLVGIARLPRGHAATGEDALPRVSVLVSCRNEERDLPRCLKALAALDYPADRLEIVLVDDRSTDGTGAVIAALAARDQRVIALDTHGDSSNLPGKSRGIAIAANAASGDWLFITDADAAVPPGWIRSMLSQADARTGIVTGPVDVEGEGLAAGLERITMLGAMAIMTGLAGLGVEPVPSGPNMAIRSGVYRRAGGLEASRIVVAEDIAIWRMASDQGLNVRLIADPQSTVVVTPAGKLAAIVSQQRRWLGGGLVDGPSFLRQVVALVALAATLLTGIMVLTVILEPAVGVTMIAVLALALLVLIAALAKRLFLSGWVRQAPLGLVYVIGLFLWLPVSVLLVPRITWRGEGYADRYTSGGGRR